MHYFHLDFCNGKGEHSRGFSVSKNRETSAWIEVNLKLSDKHLGGLVLAPPFIQP